jgi:hypothetical protein
MASFGLASTDRLVLVPCIEFEKRAAAAREKERRVKERAKGKAKLIGSSGGTSRTPRTAVRKSRSIFHTCLRRLTLLPSSGGTRSSVASDEESLKGLLERSEGAIRDVGVRLNELSGRLLEIGDMQAAIWRKMGNM